MKARWGGGGGGGGDSGIAPPVHNHGVRKGGWLTPHFGGRISGKDPISTAQESGWASGPKRTVKPPPGFEPAKIYS